MSRALSDLEPVIEQMAHRLIGAAATIGMELYVVHTFRTIEEQDAIYAKGRTAPGDVVTNVKGGASYHNYGLAFDVAFEDEYGKPVWDGPWDLLGRLGEQIGLEWGGRWTKPDMGHFQAPGIIDLTGRGYIDLEATG